MLTETYLIGEGQRSEEKNNAMPAKSYVQISFDSLARIWGREIAIQNFLHVGEGEMFDENQWRPGTSTTTFDKIGDAKSKIKSLWEEEVVQADAEEEFPV